LLALLLSILKYNTSTLNNYFSQDSENSQKSNQKQEKGKNKVIETQIIVKKPISQPKDSVNDEFIKYSTRNKHRHIVVKCKYCHIKTV
jgi:hypothetical protein